MSPREFLATDPDGFAARYRPLVLSLAAKLSGVYRAACFDIQDLIQAGYVGLIEAARRFDPERGVKFDTYCWPCIRGAMLDAARSCYRIPGTIHEHQVERSCDSEFDRALLLDELRSSLTGNRAKVVALTVAGYTPQEIGRQWNRTRDHITYLRQAAILEMRKRAA